MSSITSLSLAGLAFAVIAVAAPARSQDVPLSRLFSSEADVIADAGTVILELPDEVVAACRPDLSDLRLFDADDQEIPFAFDLDGSLGAAERVPQVVDAKLLDVDRQEFGREHGPAARRESYVIAVPEEPPASGAWELHLEGTPARFVRQARVEAATGDGEPVTLIDGESVFRLSPAQGTKTVLELPPIAGDRLRVTLEGEGDVFVEPRFSFRSERQIDRHLPIVVPLETVSTQTRSGRSIITVNRPTGIVPARLRVDSTTSWFDRPVDVWDVRQGFPDRRLASGRIRRSAQTNEPQDREVALAAAAGQQLRIEIDGGDSPALAHLRLVAVSPRPRLRFDAPAADADGRVAVLRFGGGRVPRPEYDIAGTETRPPGAAKPATARLVNLRVNEEAETRSSLGFAMRPGGVVDVRLFAYERTIVSTASGEDSTRLRLAAEDLAILRPDLADIRIVDREHRQWPFLVNREAALELVPFAVSGVVHKPGESRYSFTPATRPVLVGELAIDTDAPFFDRDYELTATLADDQTRKLSAGKLRRRVGERSAPVLSFAPAQIKSIELTIQNGDDSPIEIDSAHTSVEVPEIFLIAPAGTYTMLLGYPDVEAPQYEIAQARDAILTAPTSAATVGDLRQNPEFSQRSRYADGAALRTAPQILLWAALVGAVLVLGVITLRIVRSEGPRAA